MARRDLHPAYRHPVRARDGRRRAGPRRSPCHHGFSHPPGEPHQCGEAFERHAGRSSAGPVGGGHRAPGMRQRCPLISRRGAQARIVRPDRAARARLPSGRQRDLRQRAGQGHPGRAANPRARREQAVIRIVLADDHTIVREGLKGLLVAAGDMEVVGEASDGGQVMERVRGLDFDLLLLDMSMPGRSGIELIRQVRAEKPKLKVLILSMHEESQYAVRAIRAGASGYLTKESASRQLVDAIRKVASGGAFISAEVAQQLALGAMPDARGEPHEALSDREFQVFLLIAGGKSVSDIAAQLNLSVKTVSTHKSNLMQKMGLSTTTELVRYALSHRLLDESTGA